MSFWLSVMLFTLFIAFICFYPLLKSSTNSSLTRQTVKRDELNKALYFQRLAEIERDEAQGLLENATQVKTELQQTLLEDIPESVQQHENEQKTYGKIWFVSGLLALSILSLSAYLSVGAWQAEAMLEKTYQKLPHFHERLKEEQHHPLNESELQQFSTALRLHLQKQPSDAKSWWLLGQIAMNTNKGQLALDSYARAHQLEPDNIEYKLSYARILMFSEDTSDKTKGDTLLKEVIRKDHSNLEALGLLAFRYFETEDYKMAAVTWSMMLRLLPEDDPRVTLIERSIHSALASQEAQEEAKRKPE
ncbi:TPA: c-type cytochrome biogenesis protein CcmI [Pasteurella multocida]|uniref:C-type cytochrome biogenesis protein CcmI n=1 Tax=Pasteurella multocida TaxID=747 RepID=A0A849CCH4_PASMD|nr:c-type cytochrome biogenesis protein CcmI [Pasteurella multocida]AFF24533.1 cytochrome c-type biogenesis protein CcmI [Pasteurella multocida subsp. multocida str. HN06]AFI46498.1 CcmH [Pasteurella multocida subsp. multocida str. 3480]AWW53704.1 c-type cytochrome biogenesis protein CcmI [Pasteurella multocida]EPE72969.1 protein CcmH [Pasteurella multocida 671/90]MCH1906474.1 c-type cytochrome biogenesis protein CcmI [Pasteurella multocida]